MRRQLFAPCPCSVFPGRPIPVTAPFLERTLWYLRQEAFPIRLEPGSGFCGAGRHSVATLARMQAPLGEKLSPLTSRMIALMESVPIHFAFSRHPEISGFPATKITENQANNRPAAVSLRATRAAAGREEAFESPSTLLGLRVIERNPEGSLGACQLRNRPRMSATPARTALKESPIGSVEKGFRFFGDNCTLVFQSTFLTRRHRRSCAVHSPPFAFY